MSEFCFYTNHVLLNSQSNNGYGPLSSDPNIKYRLQNLHSATSSPAAFAITQGEILVQEVSSDPSLVNVVLRPHKQPDLDLPKIEYIIYKGILKSSLVNGIEVAAAGTNDLTQSIWDAQINRNLKVENATGINPNETPNADCLGINYTTGGTAPYLANDDTPLDTAFYNKTGNFQLPTVQKGWEIGTFSSTSFGVLIALEQIGSPHTFKLSRELDSIITVNALSGSPTQVEIFEHNHSKENVLSFMDDAAFFGSFYLSKLDLRIGAAFEEKEKEEIYDLILTKYLNKDAVYLDIRNEFGTSFDYYLNYGRNIKASFEEGAATSTLNYYRSNWPILKLQTADFATVSTLNKNFINLGFPEGSNDECIIFLSRAYRNKRKFRKLRYKKKFEQLDFTSGFSGTLELITPNKEGTTALISGFYKLVYLKSQVAANGALDFSPERSHYLDFAFPIIQNAIPFVSTSGVVKYKTYNNLSYIDTISHNGTTYMANTCIALDDFNLTLLALPNCFLNGKNVRINPVTSLIGEVVENNGHFLDYLDTKLSKSMLTTVDVNIGGINDKLLKMDKYPGAFSDSIFNNFDSDYLTILIEKATYSNLDVQINSSSIVSKYGVWFFVNNLLHTVDGNGQPITEITLGLSGLEHSGNSILRKNLATSIKIYANEHI